MNNQEFQRTVCEFNRLKMFLLQWKHEEECNCKEVFPATVRDKMKRDFNAILEKYPDINNIMPQFNCSICEYYDKNLK